MYYKNQNGKLYSFQGKFKNVPPICIFSIKKYSDLFYKYTNVKINEFFLQINFIVSLFALPYAKTHTY